MVIKSNKKVSEEMKNQGYGICRVSSVSQTENTSLKNQRNKIEQYCQLNEIELIDIIEEVYTGTTSDRDSLNTLKQLVENGQCDTVVVFKIDRLMRSFTEGVVFLKYLLDNEVNIMSVSEEIRTDTVSGRFLLNILLSMSEMERDTIVQRMNVGKIEKFNEKKKVSGRICYGYKKHNDEIVIDDEESKIVKYIFSKYNSLTKRGLSKIKRMKQLKKLLKMNDFKYRGRDFDCQNINYILNNRFYVGEMTYGDKMNSHDYGNIVSKRMFNMVTV
jgi:site-specific DNA recombinase|tara:strand:- start:1698 stop:2516 length:819 start_codon:yes stop_codon:yes gene_type:complete